MVINDTVFNASLDEILNELKAQLELNNIALFRTFKNSGDNIMTQCPYHKGGQERRPSAGFHKDSGVFHCFTCGETHTLPEVISYCFGRDDYGIYGWNWLLKNFISIGLEERKDVELDLERGKGAMDDKCILGRDSSLSGSSSVANISFVSEETLDSYRYYHPYMYQRKLTNDIIDLFDIGYDKDTECITFPIRDEKGNCLFVARRSVNYKYFNYPSGAEKPVYGLYELSKTSMPDELIICESMLDALTCWVYGKKAVALNGLGNQLQFEQLRKLPCRKFILATDNDEAGMSARARLKKELSNKLVTEYILPSNRKDINELSREEFDNLQEAF